MATCLVSIHIYLPDSSLFYPVGYVRERVCNLHNIYSEWHNLIYADFSETFYSTCCTFTYDKHFRKKIHSNEHYETMLVPVWSGVNSSGFSRQLIVRALLHLLCHLRGFSDTATKYPQVSPNCFFLFLQHFFFILENFIRSSPKREVVCILILNILFVTYMA